MKYWSTLQHHAKWNKPDVKDKYCMTSLKWSIYNRQFRETESRRKVSRDWSGGGGHGELLPNGYKMSVCSGEKVLEIDSGNGCTTSWMSLILLICTL